MGIFCKFCSFGIIVYFIYSMYSQIVPLIHLRAAKIDRDQYCALETAGYQDCAPSILRAALGSVGWNRLGASMTTSQWVLLRLWRRSDWSIWHIDSTDWLEETYTCKRRTRVRYINIKISKFPNLQNMNSGIYRYNKIKNRFIEFYIFHQNTQFGKYFGVFGVFCTINRYFAYRIRILFIFLYMQT